MMRDRLQQIHDLLAPDGSVWVHLDDVEMPYCRVLMDEIFGRANFVATVVWQKVYSPRMDAQAFSTSQDYLIVYSKNPGWVSNKTVVAEGENNTEFAHEDEAGRRYAIFPLRKWGSNSLRTDGPSGWFPITSPEGEEVWPMRPDGREGTWRWGAKKVAAQYEELVWRQSRSQGIQPYVKQYAAETVKPPETWWPRDEVGTNREAKFQLKKILGPNVFDTPKPERLLARILSIGSDPGDIVLDCFVGSGTTAAVATKMRRRWVAIERSRDTVEESTLPRLKKIVAGQDDTGVTTETGWDGGGGFRVLDVAASMFTADSGRVVLAGWAAGGLLGECVAAQAGFPYDDSDPPFAGRKGKQRLAVVDGLVNEDVIRLLAGWLADGELLTVYGTAVDPACRSVLAKIRRGSVVKRIPQAVLDDYRGRAASRSQGLDWPSLMALNTQEAAV